MPIFEYLCHKCGRTTEKLTSVRNMNRVVDCEDCQVPMERLVCTPFIHCVGEGFYKPIAKEPEDD